MSIKTSAEKFEESGIRGYRWKKTVVIKERLKEGLVMEGCVCFDDERMSSRQETVLV